MLILLQPNLFWLYIMILSGLSGKKIWFLCCVQGQSTAKVQNFNDCASRLYLLCCWTFCNKLGRVIHHHGAECYLKRLVYYHHRPECYLKRLFYYLEGQGHREGIVSTISTELLIFLQPNWIVLNCCVQDQDHSGNSELHWIFVLPIFSVLLISWQPNYVC